MAQDKEIFPLQFIGQSFYLLFKVTIMPARFKAGETGWLAANQSFSELVLKIQEKVFPLAAQLLMLGIATIVILIATDLCAYELLHAFADKTDWEWAVRNLLFVSLIAVGMGGLLLLCVNMAAGLYTIIAGNFLSLCVFLIASLDPSLKIWHVGFFSNSGNQQGLSYALGAFAIGSCLVLYSSWHRRVEPADAPIARNDMKSVATVVGNFSFTFLLIVAYAALFYWVSQRFPGQDNPYLFVGMLCVPALSTVLIRWSRNGKSIDWKDLVLLCTPVIAFLFAAFSIYKFLYNAFFPGQFPHAPSGSWIEGAGLGILIGIIVGSYFIFIHLLIGSIIRGRMPDRSAEELTVLLTTLFTWLSCILLGEFNHLNSLNKPYTIVWLIAGILIGYLVSRLRYRAARALIILLPLTGSHIASSSAFPPSCSVSGPATVHATGLGLVYDRQFNPTYDLNIHIASHSRDVTVDVTHKGHSSTLKGTLITDSLIQLTEGQPFPQEFEGDGFSANLNGTLKKGFLTCIHNKVRMFADLIASGEVKWSIFTVPVKGTIQTDAHN